MDMRWIEVNYDDDDLKKMMMIVVGVDWDLIMMMMMMMIDYRMRMVEIFYLIFSCLPLPPPLHDHHFYQID